MKTASTKKSGWTVRRASPIPSRRAFGSHPDGLGVLDLIGGLEDALEAQEDRRLASDSADGDLHPLPDNRCEPCERFGVVQRLGLHIWTFAKSPRAPATGAGAIPQLALPLPCAGAAATNLSQLLRDLRDHGQPLSALRDALSENWWLGQLVGAPQGADHRLATRRPCARSRWGRAWRVPQDSA